MTQKGDRACSEYRYVSLPMRHLPLALFPLCVCMACSPSVVRRPKLPSAILPKEETNLAVATEKLEAFVPRHEGAAEPGVIADALLRLAGSLR